MRGAKGANAKPSTGGGEKSPREERAARLKGGGGRLWGGSGRLWGGVGWCGVVWDGVGWCGMVCEVWGGVGLVLALESSFDGS